MSDINKADTPKGQNDPFGDTLGEKKNIYFCREKDEFAGLFVVASTRGKAKLLFAKEVDCQYIDVRSEIRRREVGIYPQGCLDCWAKGDRAFLALNGLKYDDWDEWGDEWI